MRRRRRLSLLPEGNDIAESAERANDPQYRTSPIAPALVAASYAVKSPESRAAAYPLS